MPPWLFYCHSAASIVSVSVAFAVSFGSPSGLLLLYPLRLALQRLTYLYPVAGLLACVPLPQAPIFIESKDEGLS
jgi:hypothetical protein